MDLKPGDKFDDRYQLLSKLGEGGMGEVWKARDLRIDRIVALKVSKAEFTDRFKQEARLVGQLNHRNICILHDVGPNYLVMEFIDGVPLVSPSKPGPLPLEKAVEYAGQILDALDHAHRNAITHRDLKPGNVMVTKEGIKLLDFGLAKQQVTGLGPDDVTIQGAMTAEGQISGTLQYMSPEQLNGKKADARSDIFAFGCVLYEMLSGRKAFSGSTAASVIASILEREPEPLQTTPPLDRVIRTCLAKDPDERWQSARDLKLELEWIAAAPEPGTTPAAHSKFGRLAVAAAALALVTAASLAFALWKRPADVQKTSTRFTIPLPPGQELTTHPAITRDGRTIAYVTQQGTDDTQLYLRDLNSFEARPVAGSSGAAQPFFSPDGKWVAFFAQGQLQKAEVAGGAPIRLVEAAYAFGGTWNEDNTIIYAASLGSGLLRIPATGGTAESLTKPDGAANGYAHVFPQALPGGRSILFTIWGQTQGNAVLSLDSRRWELVLPVNSFSFGIFDPLRGSKGRLLIVDQSAAMMAAAFDAAHPAPTSADTTVLSNVYWDLDIESRGWLAVSNSRTAVYASGNPARTSLVWVDREGKVDEALSKDQDLYREVSLSPDGTKAAVRHGYSLWIHDLRRGTRSPLTSGNASNLLPLWSSDGTRIIFASNRGGDWDIYSQPADGSQPAEVLLKRPYDQFPCSILPDGTLLYLEINPKTSRDLWTLSPDGKTTPFRVTPFNEGEARFRPDLSPGSGSARGWVAYTSDESGRREVYVQSYPGGTDRIAVSNGGGTQPRWSPDGKELFYVTGDAVVAAAFRPDGSFGAPRRLFDRSNFFLDFRLQSYQLSPDGKRFLMIRRDEGSVPRQLNVILNWSGEAERSSPTGNK
jgi:Tol biopolymer transport system component